MEEKINKIKNWFLEKMSKIDKFLARRERKRKGESITRKGD